MRQVKRIIDYSLGTTQKLHDLRQIVAETQQLSGEATVEIKKSEGQREQIYYNIVITEEPPSNVG